MPTKTNPPKTRQPKPPATPKSLRKDIMRIVLVVAFFTAIGLVLNAGFVSFDEVREALQSDDTIGGALRSYSIFLLIAILLIGAGFPRLWVSAAAGSIYGAAVGTALGYIAALGGSLITYQLGKSVLAGVAKRRLGKRFSVWKKRLAEDAFWWVLMGRLAPLMNGTLMNIMLGAAKCPPRAFITGSLIGFLPLTITFALFGSGAAKGMWTQLLLGTALLVVATLAWRVMKPKARKR